jgi:L-amino acid N-acyltransferase YncA
MAEKGAGNWREGTKCIGQEIDGKLTAATMYDFCNGASVFVHIAVDGYIGREWLWFVFYYAFEQLKLKTIVGLVAETNFKARRLDEHLGFVLTGRIPNGQPVGDTLIYTMQKDQCRWLKLKRKHYVQTERTSAA